MFDGSPPKVRTLAELTAATNHYKGMLSSDFRWETCGTCKIMPCNPKAAWCKCREAVAERQRGYYAKWPAYKKEKHKKCRVTPEQHAKRLARARARYAANKEFQLVKQHAYNERNREKLRAKCKAYRDARPGEAAEYQRQRRAKKKAEKQAMLEKLLETFS